MRNPRPLFPSLEPPKKRLRTSFQSRIPVSRRLSGFDPTKAKDGAQSEAARRQGISRSDLGYKKAKYGIENPDG